MAERVSVTELMATLRDAPTDPMLGVVSIRSSRASYDAVQHLVRFHKLSKRPLAAIRVDCNPFVPPGQAHCLGRDGETKLVVLT